MLLTTIGAGGNELAVGAVGTKTSLTILNQETIFPSTIGRATFVTVAMIFLATVLANVYFAAPTEQHKNANLKIIATIAPVLPRLLYTQSSYCWSQLNSNLVPCMGQKHFWR